MSWCPCLMGNRWIVLLWFISIINHISYWSGRFTILVRTIYLICTDNLIRFIRMIYRIHTGDITTYTDVLLRFIRMIYGICTDDLLGFIRTIYWDSYGWLFYTDDYFIRMILIRMIILYGRLFYTDDSYTDDLKPSVSMISTIRINDFKIIRMEKFWKIIRI